MAPDRATRFAGYARARLLLVDVEGRTLVLRPSDTVAGAFPFATAVHVLTAFDPGPQRLDGAENARRQRALVAGLPAGLPRWEAVAGADDGSHEEASVVVAGLTDAEALRVAAGWGQDAIFRWTPDAWSILPCDGSAPWCRGWSLTDVGRG